MDIVATKDDPSVRIRFPRPVLDALSAEARRNGRSRNSEVVYRLAKSFDIPGNARSRKQD